jgi:hypothetical protein
VDLSVEVPLVIRALAEEVRERYGAEEGQIVETTMDRVRSLRSGWRIFPETGSSL